MFAYNEMDSIIAVNNIFDTIIHLHIVKWFHILIRNTNN